VGFKSQEQCSSTQLVFNGVRVMCNLRFSAKDKTFVWRFASESVKLHLQAKNSFHWQFHGSIRTQSFGSASIFKSCETAVEDHERKGRPSKRHVEETWKKAFKIVK
jgi:hypothetical protein